VQHRAALRAKARRAKVDYWRKMRPLIVFFACVGSVHRRARVTRIGRLFGGYILERLEQKSFAEMILPKIELDAIERILHLPGVPLADDEYIEYEIDENDVVTIWITTESGDSRVYASMDKETFEALRSYQRINEPEIQEGS